MVRSRIREYDIFARIGGDEFCLVFLECRKDVAARKMKQILEEFMCIGVDIVSNESRIVFSFSYGLIEEAGESAPKTVDEILSLADKKMYEMKRLHKRKV